MQAYTLYTKWKEIKKKNKTNKLIGISIVLIKLYHSVNILYKNTFNIVLSYL